ncbi:hypothetical protein EJ06DRAFT_525405 [Trichodelitschia bisporula]|uniref:Rhodopsin domain-containing protein n=1 Tax=Trichodelitschia bisporula TaxID=703511 RepID=A0A6G1I9F9_9PEZI|nr:hypothetical protein EJ06DRAFT_525405 [Trichodelitschia bisporula]
MSGELPPLYGIQDGRNRGGVIIISAYAWASLSAISAAARLTIALNHRLKAKWDDATSAGSVVLAVVSSVLYNLAVNAGLGRHAADLESLSDYSKFVYAAQLVGLAAIACSNVSAILLSKRIVVILPLARPLLVACGAWAVFSLFVTAFQCNAPEPWTFQNTNCPTRGYLQFVIVVANMLVDIAIGLCIVPTIWDLRMERGRKLTAVSLFALRLAIPCLAIGQLVSLSLAINSTDKPWDSVQHVLFDQAVIHLSVILTTVPRANRFLSQLHDNLAVGEITAYELDRDSRAASTSSTKSFGLVHTPSISARVLGPEPRASEGTRRL